MQFFEENLTGRIGGALQPLAGVSVTVTSGSGVPVSLYADDAGTQPITQPLTTDSTGYFSFHAQDGSYTLTFSSSQFPTFTRHIHMIDEATVQASAAQYISTMGVIAGQVNTATALAQDWANKTTGTVDGTEYSAKHYAALAAQYAQESGAQVQSDWAVTDNTSKAFIKNKPTAVGQFTNDAGYINSAGSITGNAATATRFATARAINGVLFDGTQAITVSDSTKEPLLGSGTTGQYLRGDKTWQNLNASAVGLGSVENKSSATIRGELTYANVTSALGFVPIQASSSITGNAATATKLATARLINGVPFDGSADITISGGGGGGTAASADKLTTARSIAMTGDVSWSIAAFDGSANVAAAGTLSATGVTAGTYNNSSTSVTPLTFDAKGRLVGTGAAVTISPAWGSVTSKPSTIAGYGITDAVQANAAITGGTGAKITFDSKGLVTSSASLAASDIPALDWSKITSGKPTTVVGYGITDALLASDIIDSLTSTATNKALSAAQGKYLNDQLGNVSAALAAIIG